MKTINPRYFIFKANAIAAFFLLQLFLLTFSAGAQLKIANLTLESGLNKQVGSVYRAKAVYTNMDALIRIDSLVNGASIVDVDQTNVGFDEAFQPRIQSGGNGVSYAVFTIRFVKANSTSTEFLSLFTATNLDLDGNNNLKEFCEFDLGGGGNAVFMSNTPEIMVMNKGGRYYGQNISGVEYAGIDTAADAVMFKVSKINISQFTVRLGSIVTNNAQAARQYSVYMKDFQISNPVSLPLTLLNFNAITKDNRKVDLNWMTTDHKDFSHFELERSTDGKDFSKVMVMFTESSSSAQKSYSYRDDAEGLNSKIVFYRLRLVDIDDRFVYSPVRMVRFAADNKIQLQTFPNPVTTELRVQIPAQWQDKSTVYEIFNSNGVMVQRVQVARASQIQQLNIQSLGSGSYIVRVINGTEMNTSRFIKQ
jgi:hypothetical protein